MKALTKGVVALVICLALFGAGFATGTMYQKTQEPQLNALTIQTEIADCSDLATSKLAYTGMVHYESGDIPLINKKAFTMVYSAEVRAGVDLSQAIVAVNGKSISVTLPQATVQSVSIDPSSLSFYDSQFALFNWESKEDTAQALIAANEDVSSKVDEKSMISQANMQAQVVVENLLAPFTDDSQGYSLTVSLAS